MIPKIEKQLRSLWKSIRSKNTPYPDAVDDIEEFLAAEEWGLALEHILDWAAAEKKLAQAEKSAIEIRAEMKKIPKKTNG
ncbi:MAG: hypothetical protein SFW65_05345 [Alphaproteobacteria bacterium]|nr:hypothetical protein [Alphaproteobacteria bacterium]